MSTTADKLRELRFNRMRLGPAAGNIISLLSEPDVSLAIVPLTEAQHEQCLEIITHMDAPDSIVGAGLRDRRNAQEILFRALRNPDNLDEQAFETREEMLEVLEVGDLNHLLDAYFEMSESDNPQIAEFTNEELEEVKKVLQEVDLNGLSGRQWYALRRFLFTLGLTLLPANSLGSTSTNLLTMMSDAQEFTPTAFPSGSRSDARSAENL